jgi:hypothetical protein
MKVFCIEEGNLKNNGQNIVDEKCLGYIKQRNANLNCEAAMPLIHTKLKEFCFLQFTAAYCGLFKEAGVPPKRKLTSFIVTPDAAIQPGK